MTHAHVIVQARRRSSLARALGPAIAEALAAPDVVEAMVNVDGKLWLDRVGSGLGCTAHTLSVSDRETAIRILAHEAGEMVGEARPALAAILPESAARVQALLPPLVEAPILAIRKRPTRIYRLSDYVADGIATAKQADVLAEAVKARANIVVAGGTGSGKTTLLNALLAEAAFRDARIIILEDTAELQCTASNCLQLLTKRTSPTIGMRDLVQMSLRLRPDRIVVGEVRDGAALEVLKAWNTGHPGGLLTLHANSAHDALTRLEDLTLEQSAHAPRRLIASAVDLVVFITRTETGRAIADIAHVRGLSGDAYDIQSIEGTRP